MNYFSYIKYRLSSIARTLSFIIVLVVGILWAAAALVFFLNTLPSLIEQPSGSFYEAFAFGLATLISIIVIYAWRKFDKMFGAMEIARENRIRQEILKSDDSFFLLLRSFREITQQTEKQSDMVFTSTGAMPTGAMTEATDEVKLLLDALTGIGWIVMLAEYPLDAEQRYSGQRILRLNENTGNWHELFSAAAENAQGLILLPESSSGVSREILTISRSPWLDKNVVVMPPQAFHGGSYSQRWQELKDRFPRYRFPEYDNRGLLCRPNRDFSVAMAADFPTKASEIESAILRLIAGSSDGSPPPRALRDIMDELAIRERTSA